MAWIGDRAYRENHQFDCDILYFGSERKMGERGVIGLAYNFLVNLDAKKNDTVVYAKLTKPTKVVEEIKGAFVSALNKKDF